MKRYPVKKAEPKKRFGPEIPEEQVPRRHVIFVTALITLSILLLLMHLIASYIISLKEMRASLHELEVVALQQERTRVQNQQVLEYLRVCDMKDVYCPGEPQRELQPRISAETQGIASWLKYERPDTCAALLWPKGTKLKVSYHGRSVVCIRRDSGPYVPGRIVDLSSDQFAELASLETGIINVTVTPL